MANLKGQDGSFLVLFKDDSKKEVFLVFRTDYPIWVLTGGGIEPGETPKQAATREVFEETGFKIKILRQIGQYQYPHKSTYLFEGQYLSGTYKPEYEGNIGRWFFIDRLPLDLTSSTKRKIIDATNHHDQPFLKVINNELPLRYNLHLLARHPHAFIRFIQKNFKPQK